MTISEEERTRRQEAVRFARANIELEGFTIPANVIDRMEQFMDGGLTLAELINEPTVGIIEASGE